MGPSTPEKKIIADRYELEERIGAGGMGEVWRAKHKSLHSRVAIKFLMGAHTTSALTRQRFLNEARIAAQLRSRHAVQVHDFGVSDEGLPYLVMEFLEGETLEDRLERGRLGPVEAVKLLGQAARALDRAHGLRIIHRDFKPANVIVCRDEDGQEIAKVLDFGVAKLLDNLDLSGDRFEALRTHGDGSQRTSVKPKGPTDRGGFTRTGSMLGTPAYMAPEQIDQSADVSPTVDTWAFGVVAYQCLTGTIPFDGSSYDELFARIRAADCVPMSKQVPGLPPQVDEWFRKACALRPDERYASLSDAVRQLSISLGIAHPAISDILNEASSEPFKVPAPVSSGAIAVAPPRVSPAQGSAVITEDEGPTPESNSFLSRHAMHMESLPPDAPSLELDTNVPNYASPRAGQLGTGSGRIEVARAPRARAPRPSDEAPSEGSKVPVIVGALLLLVLLAGGTYFLLASRGG